ncbi:MAG: SH3 domain-containing protein [Bacteroidetes bacterium]|nr:SH3 domain-containing protein [Bacteroidota bacterium]
MSGFLETLSAAQMQNVEGIIACMKRNNITNTLMQAAILAVISKESSFIPKAERDYSTTANSRIRDIFGQRVKQLSDSELTGLKKDPKAFFDLIYGGRYGNAADEGFKYRGRGYNQLTFKDNYRKTAERIKTDIVQFPDKLNEPAVATEAVISYFIEKFGSAPKAKLALYSMTDINSAKTIEDAVNAAYHANTGWGKTREQIITEKTGGYAKAKIRVHEFYELISGKPGPVSDKPVADNGTALVTAPTRINLKRVCVIAKSLNVRVKPDAKSAKVTDRDAAVAGEVLIVYTEKDGWYKIADSKEHWVAARYCTPVKRATVNTAELIIRSGPSASSAKKGSLTKGQEVFVFAEKDSWCKIAPDEKWVAGEFLKF